MKTLNRNGQQSTIPLASYVVIHKPYLDDFPVIVCGFLTLILSD